MLSASLSMALGVAFVLLGGINVWLVLEAWSRVQAAKVSARMLMLHRIGGYLFIGLFCVMTYYMLARLGNGGDNSGSVMLHMALAMILSPLLLIKVLVARYYNNQQNLLMPIGLTIFVLSFVLIASTAAPYLARPSKIERVAINPEVQAQPVAIDMNLASDLMQKRCSKCHNLDRVVGARKDAPGWIRTVEQMRAMPGAGISGTDAQMIVSYLVSQNPVQESGGAAKMEVARALVDQRCARCHSLDRVYKTVQTPDKWRETVNRMVQYASGSAGALQPGEDEAIISYLSATQTPQAANLKRAQVDAASSSGRSLIAQQVNPTPPPVLRPSQFDSKSLGLVSLVFLGAAVLVIRRPRSRRVPAGQPHAAIEPNPANPARPQSGPLILQLVQITPQTSDSRTLRFAVMGGRAFRAMPGQFLTFSFLFNGRKEVRCYSICSSPARTGYVEITPKRLTNGFVSTFLNDHAAIGMTVEATGPFGQFFFNQHEHKKIVLIAAGSGITPMMAMLSYIDDLCLDTEVNLLYCVRTEGDIIFRQELEDLRRRLRGFRYYVLLSQPDLEWTRNRGHLDREFIQRTVPNLRNKEFFLCGPPGFMNTARGILAELGVQPERIRREVFGGMGVESKALAQTATGSAFTVEFAKSGKTCTVLEGQTLLEAAAEAGVQIPSACRQGQCGTCRTRLLKGQVRMTAENGLDPEAKSLGFVLTCVGHAEESVSLDA
jgi:ferredoxin-NADP reductase/mono/diheme cytochrome c family protein